MMVLGLGLNMPQLYVFKEELNDQGMIRNRTAKMKTIVVSFNFSHLSFDIFDLQIAFFGRLDRDGEDEQVLQIHSDQVMYVID
jgi:hypothetical protein